MRASARLILLLTIAAPIAVAAPEKTPEKLPYPETVAAIAPETSVLKKVIDGYSPKIGRYPPALKDEADRRTTYESWSATLADARAYHAKHGDTESAILALARLNRQGHNLDVASAGANAVQWTAKGLEKFPDSIPMNFEAAYLYLSINPEFHAKGEAALLHLRKLTGTNRNLEIERGLFFAYLYQKRTDEALKQLDYCLTLAPQDKMLRQMRDGMTNAKVEVKTTP